jgi:hypothetical protein
VFDNVKVQVLPPQITFTSTETFDDGIANLFTGTTGSWTVTGGRYVATPGTSTGFSLLDLGPDNLAVSSILDLSATLNTQGRAGFIFDRYDANTFKFVAIDAVTDQVIIGHYTAKSGWVKDAVVSKTIDAGVNYTLGVSLKGSTVSVTFNGNVVLGYVYNADTVDGRFGLLATGGVANFDNVTAKTNDLAFLQTSGSNMLAATAAAQSEGKISLTQAELDSITAAVMVRWTEALGAGDPRLAALGDIHVTLADLEGDTLGYFDGANIVIDFDAAGLGWFVDLSPTDNAEFNPAADSTTLVATFDSDALGRMDLLTVVTHEIGHALGFGDNELGYAPMSEDLAIGTRLLLPTLSSGAGNSPKGGRTAGVDTVPVPPVIDWQRTPFGADVASLSAPPGRPSWMSDFVQYLGKSEFERSPNAKIKLPIPSAAAKIASDVARRIGTLFG